MVGTLPVRPASLSTCQGIDINCTPNCIPVACNAKAPYYADWCVQDTYYISNKAQKFLVRANLTRVTSKLKYRQFPSYLLCTLL